MDNKDRIKNKCIYFIALLSICSGLFLMSYFSFLRTIEVDMTKNVKITYEGEQGRAHAHAKCAMTDLNQRLQSFYDSIEYEVEPNGNLSNGDQILIKAHYDESLAQEYHYDPIHIEKEFTVTGLPNRFENYQQISKEYVDQIQKAMEVFLKAKQKEIFKTEFSMPDAKPVLVNKNIVYSAFLNSKSGDKTDRMVNVYHMVYECEKQEYVLYYLVCVPEINDSMEVHERDIFGQKAYITENETYGDYIQRLFGVHYDVETIENPKENTVED